MSHNPHIEGGVGRDDDPRHQIVIDLTKVPRSPLINGFDETGEYALAEPRDIPTYIREGKSLFQPDSHGGYLTFFAFDVEAGNAVFTAEEWDWLISGDALKWADSKRLATILESNRSLSPGQLPGYFDAHLSDKTRNQFKVIVRDAYQRAATIRKQLGLPPGSVTRCGDLVADRVGNDLYTLDAHAVISKIVDVSITISNHDINLLGFFQRIMLFAVKARETGNQADKDAYYDHLKYAATNGRSKIKSSWSLCMKLLYMDLNGPERLFRDLLAPYLGLIDFINYREGVTTSHAPLIKVTGQSDQQAVHDYLTNFTDIMLEFIDNQRELVSTHIPESTLSFISESLQQFLSLELNTDTHLECWSLAVNKAFKTLLQANLVAGDISLEGNAPRKIADQETAFRSKRLLDTALSRKHCQRAAEIQAEFARHKQDIKTAARRASQLVDIGNDFLTAIRKREDQPDPDIGKAKLAFNTSIADYKKSASSLELTLKLLPRESFIQKLEQQVNQYTADAPDHSLLRPTLKDLGDSQRALSGNFGNYKINWDEVENELGLYFNDPLIHELCRFRVLRAVTWGRVSPEGETAGYTFLDNHFHGHVGTNDSSHNLDSFDGRGGQDSFTKRLAAIPTIDLEKKEVVDQTFSNPKDIFSPAIFVFTLCEKPRDHIAKTLVDRHAESKYFNGRFGKRNPIPEVARMAGKSASEAHNAVKGHNFMRLFLLWLDYHIRNTPTKGHYDFWAPLLNEPNACNVLDRRDSGKLDESLHDHSDEDEDIVTAQFNALKKLVEKKLASQSTASTTATAEDQPATPSRSTLIEQVTQLMWQQSSKASKEKVILQLPTSALIPGGRAYITPDFDPERDIIEAVAMQLPLDYLRNFSDPVSNALLSTDPNGVAKLFLAEFMPPVENTLERNITDSLAARGIARPEFPKGGNKTIEAYTRYIGNLSRVYYEHLKESGALSLRGKQEFGAPVGTARELNYSSLTAVAVSPKPYFHSDSLMRSYQIETPNAIIVLTSMPNNNRKRFDGYMPDFLQKSKRKMHEIRAIYTAKYTSALLTAWKEFIKDSTKQVKIVLHTPSRSELLEIGFKTQEIDDLLFDFAGYQVPMKRAAAAFKRLIGYDRINGTVKENLSNFIVAPSNVMPPPKDTSASTTHGGSILTGEPTETKTAPADKSKTDADNPRTR